jgi:hypothetical protein
MFFADPNQNRRCFSHAGLRGNRYAERQRRGVTAQVVEKNQHQGYREHTIDFEVRAEVVTD